MSSRFGECPRAHEAGRSNFVLLRAFQVLSTIEANGHLGVEPVEGAPLQVQWWRLCTTNNKIL